MFAQLELQAVVMQKRMIDTRKALPLARRDGGFQLIELLVSVAVSGIVITAIGGSMMKMMNFASNGQNQLMAADIAQEVIDNARNMSFGRLNALCDQPQPITLLVNRRTAADATDPYNAFPRPLGQDWINLAYTQDDAAGNSKTRSNRFRGDADDGGLVQETLTRQVVAGNTTINVEVLVRWQDGRNGQHTYRSSTLIADRGIHN
jgi:type II secretory pathway pseudopilin PulG